MTLNINNTYQTKCTQKLVFFRCIHLFQVFRIYHLIQQFSIFKKQIKEMDPNTISIARLQTDHERLIRIRKNKNIRKEKVRQRRNLQQSSLFSNRNMTKQQKKQVQKERNRIAAQNSRERHKRRVEELQNKIRQIEEQRKLNLCWKCKACMNQTHSYQQQFVRDENQGQVFPEPEIQEIPFVRSSSDSSMNRGMGYFFMVIFLVVCSIFCLSGSIQSNTSFQKISNARLLTQLTERNEQQNNLPIQRPTNLNQCKNNYQYYLTQIQNPYQTNIIICNQPQLVSVRSISDQIEKDKWTFYFTNPHFLSVQLTEKGEKNIEQSVGMQGTYKITAEKAVITKVLLSKRLL